MPGRDRPLVTQTWHSAPVYAAVRMVGSRRNAALNSSYVSIILARSTVADPAAAVITLAKTAAIHT